MMGRGLVAATQKRGDNVLETTREGSRVGKRKVFLDLARNPDESPLPLTLIRAAVLCAGISSMEACRADPAATRRVNVENTVALARRFVDAGIFVVFLSSNAVFDGINAFPMSTDCPNPQTEYGRQKAEAERDLLCMGDMLAVVRFTKIISQDMPLLTRWTGDLQVGNTINPFSDAVMAPVSLKLALDVITRILENQISGITQVSANADITYEEAAHYIARRLVLDAGLIKPISSGSGSHIFPRHSTLDATRLTDLALIAPKPTDALDYFILRQKAVASSLK